MLQSNKTYYFVGELATPLLTMFESYHYDMTGMTKDELYAERDAFYWTLKAVLRHEKNKECSDQFELLVWKSDPKFGELPLNLPTVHLSLDRITSPL
jgi:Transmembrane protein 173